MKKILFCFFTAIMAVASLSIMTSCKEEDEVIIYGNTFTMLRVKVVDTEGMDLVDEWVHSNSEYKLTSVEYVMDDQCRTDNLKYGYNTITEDYYFENSNVLSIIPIGQKLSWRFKLYAEDTEELLFEGICKEDKTETEPPFNKPLNQNIQWSFQGKELPMERLLVVTLIRTEEGKYRLKQ